MRPRICCALVLASATVLSLCTLPMVMGASKTQPLSLTTLSASLGIDEAVFVKEAGLVPIDMFLDIPGVLTPDMKTATEIQIDPNEEVIGVSFQGQSFAFIKRGMNDPTKHIVNFSVKGKPLSVTYCSLVDCARVLTAETDKKTLDLRVGGLDKHAQLVLLYNQKRYRQTSRSLPLEDHQFEVMSFKRWTKKHPTTTVYLGDLPLSRKTAPTL